MFPNRLNSYPLACAPASTATLSHGCSLPGLADSPGATAQQDRPSLVAEGKIKDWNPPPHGHGPGISGFPATGDR